MQAPALPPSPPQDLAVVGGAAVSRAAALQARKLFRYAAVNGRQHAAGQCEACGWHTQPWVQCFYCSRLACERWCSVPDHLAYKRCHPHGRLPPGPAVMPKQAPCTATAEARSSCGRTEAALRGAPAGSAASSAGAAGRQPLRACLRCNRWLCCDCRQLQFPTVCVVCPALHTVELACGAWRPRRARVTSSGCGRWRTRPRRREGADV